MRLFEYADQRLIARRIAAIGADFRITNVVTHRADAQFLLDVDQSLNKPIHIFTFGSQYVEGDSLGGFLSDSG